MKKTTFGICLVGIILIPFGLFAREPLTFKERVDAQEAIERVYYNHRVWPKENTRPKPAFDKMIDRETIEAKVSDYLKKSEALGQMWQRPIEGRQLQAEMERMAKQTKDPATLKELFAALGNDPYLIAECLARPVLADRLIRSWFAFDPRFHADVRSEAEKGSSACCTVDGMRSLSGVYGETLYLRSMDESGADPGAEASEKTINLDEEQWESLLARLGGDASQRPGEIVPGRMFDLREEEDCFLLEGIKEYSDGKLLLAHVVWRKMPFREWFNNYVSINSDHSLESDSAPSGGDINFTDPGIPEDTCTDDTWLTVAFPCERSAHTAVWTGTEMIVWGGSGTVSTTYFKSGGRYNPVTDSWSAMSIGGNCPSARIYHTAVWTGTEMIIWGGYDGTDLANGGRYNPVSDSWSTVASSGAPSARRFHTAVWTGSAMIIWGGNSNTGGLYSPSTDTWVSMSTTGAPSARNYHTAVWTDTEMIIWGGFSTGYLNSGGRYNPGTDTWTMVDTTGAPAPRQRHTAVWTGSEMIVWGGNGSGTSYFSSGGRYNPTSNSWTATSTGTDCPVARIMHTAVWTGTVMVVWGGYYYDGTVNLLNSGGRYNPASDSWTAVSSSGTPSARSNHTAVWTESEMIVWGGWSSSQFNNGGRYNPASDSWVPTVSNGAPSRRESYSTVWTGGEMIIWGGVYSSTPLETGGKYDPALDNWSATETNGAPAARSVHPAIWTGSEMIVWGGRNNGTELGDGGRYNPVSDSWTTVDSSGAPAARHGHTAVWTGTEMVVWGGTNGTLNTLNTGGRYNPTLNTWTPTSTTGAPPSRSYHSAVWTGTEMIVWGGAIHNGSTPLGNGGRYNMASDSWVPMSTLEAPSARYGHATVWTGSTMIIWGGVGSGYLNTGGIYSPSSDIWMPTAITGAPTGRYKPSALWTGGEMIVWGGSNYLTNLGDGSRYNQCQDTWRLMSKCESGDFTGNYTAAVWTGSKAIFWKGLLSRDLGLYCASVLSWEYPPLLSPDQVSVDSQACGSVGEVGHSPLLVWSDVDNESGYSWEVLGGAACSGSILASGTIGAGTTNATVSPALLGGAYSWHVRADGDGVNFCDSPWTCACPFNIPCYILSAPSQLSVNYISCGGGMNITDSTPYLSWSNVSNESDYAWEIWDGEGCTGVIKASGTTGANTAYATCSTLLGDGTYYWRVKSRGDGTAYCDSDWTCGCPFTVNCPEVVSVPTLVSVDGQACDGTINADSPVLLWTDVSNNGGYRWEVWDGAGCTGTLVTGGTTTEGVTTATPLIPGGTYYWRVMVLGNGNSTCDGPWSCGCEFSLSCQQTLPAPIQLLVDSESCSFYIAAVDDTPVLEWNDVDGESGYEWEIWTGVLCSGTLVASGSLPTDNTLVEISPALAVGTYYWRVRALGDCSSWSTSPWACGCPFTVGSPACDGTALTNPVISIDTDWVLSGSPYLVNGTLTVNNGATLDVDAGVIVKFSTGASAVINGTLNLNGTSSDLVVFGSLNDNSLCGPSTGGTGTPQTGSWRGITYSTGSSGSVTETLISHADNGLTVQTENPFTCGNLTVEDCGFGVICGGSSAPVFNGLDLTRAELLIEGNSHPTFNGGVWDGGGIQWEAGIIFYETPDVGNTPDPSFNSITLQNMAPGVYPAMRVEATDGISGETHWADLPFILPYEITVLPGASLSVYGTTLYGETGSRLVAQGTLNVGSPGRTTLLRSNQQSPSAGDWAGIVYEAGSSGSVTDAVIRHAENGLTVQTENPFTCGNLTVEDCGFGVNCGGSSAPVFNGLDLTRAELWVEGNSHPVFNGGVWDGGGTQYEAGTIFYEMPEPGNTPDPTFNSITLQNMAPGLYPAVRVEAPEGINGETHWADLPFILPYEIIVLPGAVLSVYGTTIYGDPLSSLVTQGTLNIGSSGRSTLLRSNQQSPYAGDWAGITYSEGSSGSVTEAVIRHATTGITVQTENPFTCGNLTVEDCGFGVNCSGISWPEFNGLDLTRAELRLEGNSHPTFNGGVWDGGGTQYEAGTIFYEMPEPGNTPDPTFNSITLQNMVPGVYPAVRVEAPGYISGDTHWADVPFILPYEITVGGYLSVYGTTIYGEAGSRLVAQGMLDVGSPGRTTLLRSNRQSPAAGDWAGITYSEGSSGSVTEVVIRHATTGITVQTENPFILSGSFVESCATGMQSSGDSSPRIENCSFTGNATSILVSDTAMPDLGFGAMASTGGNTIIGTGMSLENQTANTVSARRNFWGCPTTAEMDAGTENITLIWDQKDDPLIGLVDYSEWLGSENKLITAVPDTDGGARDVVLSWDIEPIGPFAVMKGTDAQNLSQVGTSPGPSWRDAGALDTPGTIFYRIDGPCD